MATRDVHQGTLTPMVLETPEALGTLQTTALTDRFVAVEAEDPA